MVAATHVQVKVTSQLRNLAIQREGPGVQVEVLIAMIAVHMIKSHNMSMQFTVA